MDDSKKSTTSDSGVVFSSSGSGQTSVDPKVEEKIIVNASSGNTDVNLPQQAELNTSKEQPPQSQNQQELSSILIASPGGSTTPSSKTPTNRKRKNLILLVLLPIVLLLVVFVIIYAARNAFDKSFGQKGEIVWWGTQFEESDIKPLIDEYQSQNPGINIKYVKQSSKDYRERLLTSLSSNQGPDIYEIHNSWPIMFTPYLSTIPQSIISKSEFAQNFYSDVVSSTSFGGGQSGIPLYFDTLTLFVNQDVFVSAGEEVPKTWGEIVNLSKRLTRTDDQGNIIQGGIAIGITSNVDHWQEILGLMMAQNGAKLSKPAGRPTEDALSFFNSFSYVNKTWDEKQPPSTMAFASGKLAMYIAPSWRTSKIVQINPNLKFRTVLIPQAPKNVSTEPDLSYATYWIESVWSKSVNKDSSWKLLKYLSQGESLNKLYQSVKTRSGTELFSPRRDMAIYYTDNPILDSVAAVAANSKSWYLADSTYDGEEGVNTQMGNIYSKLIRDWGKPGRSSNVVAKLLQQASDDIDKVLSKYSASVKK